MPLITQKWIYRTDLQSNPKVLYLFGDNRMRQGFGGQAKEMRGEPNAIGIATKRLPSQHKDSYFDDWDMRQYCLVIWNDLKPAITHLKQGNIVVLPADGLGTGLSELPVRAPNVNKYLEDMLAMMKEL